MLCRSMVEPLNPHPRLRRECATRKINGAGSGDMSGLATRSLRSRQTQKGTGQNLSPFRAATEAFRCLRRSSLHRHFFAIHTVELLFVAFGSGVPAETVPESQTEPTADRQESLIVTLALAPNARLAHVQVTVETPTVQVPPVVVLILGAGPVNRLEFATREMF